MPSSVLELSDRELTYLLIALRKHEKVLRDIEDEDEMPQAHDDLLMIQYLIDKLKAAKVQAGGR